MNILVLNDIHDGSQYGLASRANKSMNAFQTWAIDQWEYMVRLVLPIIDTIVLLGDMVDGNAHKDSSTLWLTDVDEQVSDAVRLIQPLLYGGKIRVLGVTGSGYHYGKGSGFDADRQVTEKLGGKHHKVIQTIGTPYGDIVFTHKSRNTMTEQRIVFQRTRHSEMQPVAMLVGAHLHRYEEKFDGAVRIIHNGCWEYPTEFMGYGNTVSIGALLITVDNTGITHKPLLYSIPREVEEAMQGYTGMSEDDMKQRKAEELRKVAEKYARPMLARQGFTFRPIERTKVETTPVKSQKRTLRSKKRGSALVSVVGKKKAQRV